MVAVAFLSCLNRHFRLHFLATFSFSLTLPDESLVDKYSDVASVSQCDNALLLVAMHSQDYMYAFFLLTGYLFLALPTCKTPIPTLICC